MIDIFTKLASSAATLRARGPSFIYHYAREIAWFDWINRTDTSRRKQNAANIDANIHYVASFTSVIECTLAHLRRHVGSRFADLQFIDIGSGKGKVVLVYGRRYGAEARYAPMGIEYDSALCVIANANIARMGLDRIAARVVHDDAMSVRAHLVGNEAIFFLYNPFTGRIFREFVQRAADKPHFLIYVDPVERSFLKERGYKILVDHSGRYHADSWLIASFDPANGYEHDTHEK
jgi:hypothetical protein